MAKRKLKLKLLLLIIIPMFLLAGVFGFLISMDPGPRCIMTSCTSQMIACVSDETCNAGLKCLTECGDPNSDRIKKQKEDFKYHDVPGDSDICSSNCLDRYPSKLLAAVSRCVVNKCSHTYSKDDKVPQKCNSFFGKTETMHLKNHSGKWWRTHTSSWDRWNCSTMKFIKQPNNDWKLYISYQIKTGKGKTIGRRIVEHIAKDGINEDYFATILTMWDTKTTERWKLLHSTKDARMFAICATTRKPRLRKDQILLIISRNKQLSPASLISMKAVAKKLGIPWKHFYPLKNNNCNFNIPVVPY